MSALTPWFAARVKPVRSGWYETAFGRFKGYSYWNGLIWSNQVLEPGKRASTWFGGANQSKRWRGLAKQP